MTNLLQHYMDIISKKANLREKTRPEGNTRKLYLQGIVDEVQEVEQEIKDNNKVYLEDELGDILRDYLNVLFYLQQEDKIHSRESVIQKSLKKYEERVGDQLQGKLRKDTKIEQKKKLIEEHNKLYNEKS